MTKIEMFNLPCAKHGQQPASLRLHRDLLWKTIGEKRGGLRFPQALAGVAAGTGIAVLAVNVLSWLWGV
jgi:hypothetical protein